MFYNKAEPYLLDQKKREHILQHKEVVLYKSVYHQIMSLLAENPKIEDVGLCFGIHDKSKIEIRSFISMVNLDNSAISFSLDYGVLYREIQRHEEKKEILVGIFHSHPEGAKLYPSQKDLHYMRFWAYPYLWLIGGCGGEEADSKLEIFSLMKKKIIEIPFLIAPV